MNRPGGEAMQDHMVRFFGGLGTMFLIYAPLRYLENKPAIFLIIICPLMSYALGWLIQNKDDK